MAEFKWTVKTRGNFGASGPYADPPFNVTISTAPSDALTADGITTAAVDITSSFIDQINVDNLNAASLTTSAVTLGTPTAQDLAEQPPDAPALVSPEDGAELDGTQAHTFSWTFSSPESGDSQAEFFFRRQRFGASLEWWDGSQWVASEVSVVSTVESVTLPVGFITTPTKITRILPSVGLNSTPTDVVIHGEGFTSETVVTVGGAAVTNFLFVNSKTIHCTVPANTGTLDVVVSDGPYSDTLVDGFVFGAARTLDVSFQHHFFGAGLESVSLYAVYSDGSLASTTPAWQYTGPSTDAWQAVGPIAVNVTDARPVHLAFFVTIQGEFTSQLRESDWALDDVVVDEGGSNIGSYSFEADNQGWTTSTFFTVESPTADLQASAFYIHGDKTPITDGSTTIRAQFLRLSGDTPSPDTGPTAAADGSFYIYTENVIDSASNSWAFSPAL